MMAAAATIPYLSVDEYLHTTYEPDAEYIDGVLEERHVGEWDHADIQTEIATIFRRHAKEWQLRAVVEIRIQTSSSRFRVADIGVVSASAPREQVVKTPPLLCIEVLSPEDRLDRAQSKCHEYLQMGVPEVWIFDPARRTVYIMRNNLPAQLHEGVLKLADTLIEIDPVTVFSILDPA